MESNKKANNQMYDFDNKELFQEEICKKELTSSSTAIKVKKHSDKIEQLFKLIPQVENIFTIHGQVGEGTFSSVLVGSLKNKFTLNSNRNSLFAIKHLIPTCHPSRIEKELKCMQDIGGKDNIVPILFCLRSLNSVVFVMPYIPHKSFSEYVGSMDVSETKIYIYNLLIALRRVHSFGIIHRDVKPSNFLYDRENKRFVLVDFGLAQEGSYQNLEKSKRKRDESNEQDNDSVQQLPKRMALHNNIFNTKLKSLNCSDEQITEKINGQKTVMNLEKQYFRSNEINRSPLKTNSSNIKNQVTALSGNNSITYIPSLTIKSVAKKLFPETGKENTCPIYDKYINAVDNKHKLNIESQQKNVSFVHQKENIYLRSISKKLQNNMAINSNKFNNVNCNCFGKAKICNICKLKKGQQAPRAGTPGFRPPEVLLKYPFQTTAIDIWAVGVILLSILSGCYPFFHSPDDMTALAELMTLFGTSEMKRIAKLLGQYLITSENLPAMDLQQLCITLKHKKKLNELPGSQNCNEHTIKNMNLNLHSKSTIDDKDKFPCSAFDLLKKLLDLNPRSRISAEEALKHPFLEMAQ